MISEISSRISDVDLYGQMGEVQDVVADNRYIWSIGPLLK
jgi:hypothetical protein